MGLLRVHFRSALLGPQGGQAAGLALLAPRGQVRRVQALTPQQGTQLAGRAALRFLQDAQLVIGREAGAASEEVPFFDWVGVMLVSFRPTQNYRRSVSSPS